MKQKIQLELVGRLPRDPGGSVGHMTLHNKHLILVSDDGLQVVDVSDPTAPTIAWSYRPKASLGHVAASENRVYVAEKETLLRVLDVSNPSRPRRVGAHQMTDEIHGCKSSARRL